MLKLNKLDLIDYESLLEEAKQARDNFINKKCNYSIEYQHELSRVTANMSSKVTNRVFTLFSECLYAYKENMEYEWNKNKVG